MKDENDFLSADKHQMLSYGPKSSKQIRMHDFLNYNISQKT